MRPILFWSHLVCGAIIAVVVLCLCVTGVLLTYKRQIEHWLTDPTVTAPGPEATPLPLEHLLRKANETVPLSPRHQVVLDRGTHAPVAIRQGRRGMALLDPYTGETLEPQRVWIRDAFSFITRFHRWFALEDEARDRAKFLVGIANLAFLFLVVSGLYLWFPRVWRRRTFAMRLLFARGPASPRARDYNWHHVMGIWMAVPLVVLIVTGSVFSFRWTGDVIYAGLGVERPERSPPGAGGGQGPRGARGQGEGGRQFNVVTPSGSLTLDQLAHLARQETPDWRELAITLPRPRQQEVEILVDRGRVVSSTDQFTELSDGTTTLQYGFAPAENDWINANVRYSVLDVERDRRAAGTEEWTTWASKTDYLELENTSILNRDRWLHRLRYGLDFTQDDLVTAYFDADGEQIERTRDIAGIYLSDTFDVGTRVSVVASLRHDDYRTQEQSTSIDTRNKSVSKKLQVSYRPLPDGPMRGFSVFALVGTGFRAPSVHETFGRGETGVTCQQGRRGFACSERVPNADLQAETNDSWEAGFRFAGDGVFGEDDQLRFSVGYVQNNVEDFIATRQLPGGETVVNGRTYNVLRSTFTNINEAEISGWEYSLNYTGNRWFASLAAQTMDGHDTTTGLNLRDVSPHSRNASVGAYLLGGRARVGLDVTSRADKEIDEDPSFNRLAYTVYDVFASYRLGERYKVQVRIENASDELYTKRFQSLSVDLQSGERQDLTYYQPGRNIKLSFEARLL